MATVSETELEQKTSEYINYVKDFAHNLKGDYKFLGKRDKFVLSIFNEDVTLDFNL